MWKFVAQACVSLLLVAGPARAISPADPGKVIHFAMPAADDGFDMVRTSNYYSGAIAESIYETLLTYDYLASPAKLVPKVAEAMPEVSDGGKTYTFHLKKGIFFTDDPAFKGKPRELTAQDFAYSFRRLLDPVNRSPSAGFLQGKIVGMDAVVAAAKKSGKFDYDAPVAGLQTPDRYTLQIQLNAPDYNFLYVIAYGALAGSAREVIDAYGLQSGQHPVGTGAYMLESYVPRSKIILVANPGYRGYTWNFEPSADPMDQQIVRDMKGKKMPQVGRIEVSVIEEEQARWLAFQDKQIDRNWRRALRSMVPNSSPNSLRKKSACSASSSRPSPIPSSTCMTPSSAAIRMKKMRCAGPSRCPITTTMTWPSSVTVKRLMPR
jgi:ABC-type transport system substrate-binding protein